MTKAVRFEHGSTIEVETEDEENKPRLESADTSFDFEDEMDAVHYGTSPVESISTGCYQSEHNNTRMFLDEGTLLVNIHE